ncbi:UDP-glucuronosyltransferase-like protein [Euroglyphus maynei]|uniref:UDP-glucuronosyltransferase n=1 Tax=Euroglyphus maynei TaxID=6958 RepID=A0A1Y3AYX3_EURMA|nr:UDP-glucuronosyltransferase-like protein [Euroglyphus maynei]
MSKKQLTVLFVTLDGYGHLNSCIGVAEKLVQRGHRVIFALERAWAGKAKRFAGIEEVLYVDPNRDPTLGANEHWIKFMDDMKATFGMPPMEALKKSDPELEQLFLDTMLNVDDEIKRLIDQVKPDIIVVDSYTTIPAVYKSGIPWVWLTSAHPLSCLPHDDLPPNGTDFPTKGDPKQREEYMEVFLDKMLPIVIHFNKRMTEEFGLEPSMHGIHHESPYLNIYAYPKEMDYLEIRPLPEKWQSFDHFIRLSEKDESFKIPEQFLKKPLGKLIYVSMGSMGCADVGLMNRLITILADSPNRFIFSLGPRKDQLMELPDNIWGECFVPQVQVLSQVDLVITHGGNNTVLESLYFGKPMIVTPLFGDQYNNAQRVTEVGFGAKIYPFDCEPQQLLTLIEQLLNDEKMKERLANISKRMQSSNSTEKVAIAIEQLVDQIN